MYGILGLLALETLQLLPVARGIFFPVARSTINAKNLRYVLAAAILMSAIDSLLNSALILPLLLAVGSLSAPNPLTNVIQVKGHSRSNPLVVSNISSG
jgi:hypothetical protein